MKFTESQVKTHRPADQTDPGFAIKGYKLRWVSGVVEARRGGRMWRVLKLSQMPKGVVDKLKEVNRSFSDGDTIRRRDLTLAYAPIEEVNERRKQLRDNQNANEAIFKGKATLADGVTKTEGSEALESVSASKFK